MRATTTSVQYVWTGLMMVCLTVGSGCGGDDDTEGSTSNNSGTTTGSNGETSIDALPERTWSWLEVEGMRCANGSPTGIGVNRNTASPNVVVYLEGGGACWDHETCYELAAASNITTGFDASAFQMQAIPAVEGIEVFRRDASNPLQDWNPHAGPLCNRERRSGSNLGGGWRR
ncbi:MAG: hypothetical protein AAFX99_09385, partial [Myxococcota bacterium]